MSETDASKENGKKKKEEEKEESRSGNNDEKEVSANGSDPEEGDQSGTSPGGHQLKGRAYLEKVNERKRTWDYFEINHPKAISDKKLEQLKEKYTRRKTEASLLLEKKKEEREVRILREKYRILRLLDKSPLKRWGRASGRGKVRRRV